MADNAAFDVLGVGNAIVDVLVRTDDAFLADAGLTKGSMRLIGPDEAEALYARLGAAVEASGGSAGNSVAGVASLGGRAAFIGKVAADQLGAIYRHDMTATGVSFTTPPAAGGPPTGRCMILVTPDGERTMNTLLGAAQDLTPDDIDPATVAAAAITLLEGYLWDPPQAKDAFRKAARIAQEAGRTVALSLSDSFCVDRYRAEFLELIRTGAVDIVLANEAELKSLYQTNDFDAGLSQLRGEAKLAAVTAGSNGSFTLSAAGVEHVPVAPVKLVDATGAGDLYAAGFLLGIARGLTPVRSAALGSLAAAEVISHIGARPAVPLAQLARDAGFTF